MFTHAYTNTPISLAAIEFNLKGYHCCYSSGMVSGMQAIIGGAMALMRSLSKRVLAGGTDAFSTLPFIANCTCGKLSPNDGGVELMRPFDASRNGWVMGEGACMLLLERESDARERNATIKGYICGFGAAQSTGGNIESFASAVTRSMQSALKMANVEPKDVGWICASANGSQKVDATEAIAIERLFDSDVPVSSIKASVGETVGAGGAVGICAAIASFVSRKIPPTLFTTTPCANICLVMGEAIDWGGNKPVLVNSIDKGGSTMSALIMPPNV